MIEIESKIFNIDKNLVIAKILSLGWIQTFEGIVSGEYYVNKDWQKIRIRQEKKGIIVCYKKKIGKDTIHFKIREEIETKILNKDSFILMLKELWFEKGEDIYKKRISFDLFDSKIEIDEYKNIPIFMEIESKKEENIIHIANLLWYSMDLLSSKSFAD